MNNKKKKTICKGSRSNNLKKKLATRKELVSSSRVLNRVLFFKQVWKKQLKREIERQMK